MTVSARYTPSLLDKETLEELFVNREEQLEVAIKSISEASTKGSLSNKLYFGPRGAGKTHIIAMIYHRAKALPGFGKKFVLSWLPEDPWTITSFEALMNAIEEHAEPQKKPNDTSKVVRVVLTENFDWILKALGPVGQRELRAHIEQQSDILLIATSTRLTEHIYSQSAPFFCFFDSMELKPFSLDEAITMLQKIAEQKGDTALAARLKEGGNVRSRLAAIAHLAGGQPRIWATFAAGLSIDRLDDMVDVLIEQLDDLMPYYQEQLHRLSPNELKAVMALIETDGAMTVQAIAEATGIEQRSLAKTLKTLTPAWVIPRKGYLTQFVDRRLSYYQLAEPLIRIAYQIKSSRGEPVKTVLDFLTAWYSFEELSCAVFPKDEYESIFHEAYMPVPLTTVDGQSTLTAQYVREAQKTASLPSNILRNNLANILNHSPFMITYSSDIDKAIMGAQFVAIDDALKTFQHEKSATSLLALPMDIGDIIESQLESETTSVGMMRLRLAHLSAFAFNENDWRSRALNALTSVTPEEESSAKSLVDLIRFGNGNKILNRFRNF